MHKVLFVVLLFPYVDFSLWCSPRHH